MRAVAATIAASLLWTACSMAGPAGPVAIEPGTNVSLRPGQSAQAGDTGLRIGFEAVLADSRCPKGEQCIVAGDATVRVWLQRGAGPRETRDLHTTPGTAQAANVLGLELRLLRLEPYPVSGSAIAKADYVATLALGPSTAAAAVADR